MSRLDEFEAEYEKQKADEVRDLVRSQDYARKYKTLALIVLAVNAKWRDSKKGRESYPNTGAWPTLQVHLGPDDSFTDAPGVFIPLVSQLLEEMGARFTWEPARYEFETWVTMVVVHEWPDGDLERKLAFRVYTGNSKVCIQVQTGTKEVPVYDSACPGDERYEKFQVAVSLK